MKEALYLEIPTANTAKVCDWLQNTFNPGIGTKQITPDGFLLNFADPEQEISVFTWSLQRTTYLKVFTENISSNLEKSFLEKLETSIRQAFPITYSQLPEIDFNTTSIFEGLAKDYPQTVKYFQKMPQGEYDLKRVYWWEKRWRDSVKSPRKSQGIVSSHSQELGDFSDAPKYDLIYVGGALGIIHAAVMARLGYKVLLLERLPFARMNREWNISRSELQSLVDLGLFTWSEIEGLINREYKDGFNKFFDANNPAIAKANILHTPKVLNIALDSEKLLYLCGVKLREVGGDIVDQTEFLKADITPSQVIVTAENLQTKIQNNYTGRLLIDAMGTASPIAWQLNGDRTFDSVCPTVGAVIKSGFAPEVWDRQYGDVLFSHGDISRGRQLIWELFPGEGDDLTIYLFHYHQICPENPGSLLEMYEDFFTILPEYRRCDMDNLVWKKPTFGYIPGFFSSQGSDRQTAFDRLISIGDAASLQSPLVFTGFGSLVRNLYRLTDLLNTALKYDLLQAEQLNKIRAYQSNISVTWLFSKGMMVPTGKSLPPARVNSILNTFFGLLANEPLEVGETFIKDRFDWLTFNRLAITAASKNPLLLYWILDFVKIKEVFLWLFNYINFTWLTFLSFIWGWLPNFTQKNQTWLEKKYPKLWFWLLTTSYNLTDGMGRPDSILKKNTPIFHAKPSVNH
jgi:lycopene cyclase CruA